jgi:hypothetical protein
VTGPATGRVSVDNPADHPAGILPGPEPGVVAELVGLAVVEDQAAAEGEPVGEHRLRVGLPAVELVGFVERCGLARARPVVVHLG